MQMKKPTDIKASWRQFSSDEIDELLEQSTNLRELRDVKRNKWLQMMRDDRWQWANGDTYIFDADGKLMDGQHRMSAIAMWQHESGQKAWLLCVEGVDRRTEATVGTGDKRTMAEWLNAMKVKNAKYVAPIVQAQCLVTMQPKAGTNTLACLGASALKVTVNGKATPISPSLMMQMDQFKRHRGIVEHWAAIAESLHKKGLARPARLAAVGFQLEKEDQTNARLFFSFLHDGAGMKDGDPILMLRERLRSVDHSMPAVDICAITIKAWQAWIQGRTIKSLEWSPTGPRPEEFPDHRITKEAG